MPQPTEHKSVQARILKYAEEIGWRFVSRSKAEERRGFDATGVYPRERAKNENTKIINLVKSIEQIAEKESDDPFLIGLLERAEAVEEQYENRQITTQEALDKIRKIYEDDVKRRKEQAEKGFHGLTFFIYRTLIDKDLSKSEETTKRIKEEFVNNPNWKTSEKELRELRKGVYYAILAVEDDTCGEPVVSIDKAASIVKELFNHLFIAYDL